MSDVALGRFNRWIEKFFNAKGGPTVVDVQPTFLATLSVDKGVDHRYLEGWNRFAIVANVGAVAAQNSRARFRNPVGSNVIAILEQVSVFTTGSADQPILTYGATVTDLVTLITLTFSRMDPRGNAQPTVVVSANQQAAGGTAFLQRAYNGPNLPVDFINNVDQQIPVLPGQVLDLQAVTVNNNLVVSFMWRERALESSELT